MVLTRAKAAREAGTDQCTTEAAIQNDGGNTKPLTRARAALIAKSANSNQTKDEEANDKYDPEVSEVDLQYEEDVDVKTESGVGGHRTAFEQFLQDQLQADQAKVQLSFRQASRVTKTRCKPGPRSRERAKNWKANQQRNLQTQLSFTDHLHVNTQITQQNDLDHVLDDILKPRANVATEFAAQAEFIPLDVEATTNVVPQHKEELFPTATMNSAHMQMILVHEIDSNDQEFGQDFFNPDHQLMPAVAEDVTANNAMPLAFNPSQIQSPARSMTPAMGAAASTTSIAPPTMNTQTPTAVPQRVMSRLSRGADALLRLQVILGYKFTNREILIEAVFILRWLFDQQNTKEATAKLKFIGAQAMALAMWQAGYHDRTMTLSQLGGRSDSARSNVSLATVVRNHGLDEFGEHGRDEASSHPSMLKAIIGAVQVDGGLQAAVAVMKKLGVF